MNKLYILTLILLVCTQFSFSQTLNTKDSIVYVCPPCGGGTCDQLQFDKPGICPHCGMVLKQMSLADFKAQLAKKPLTVCFYLQNNVETLDFAGPLEVFNAAGFNTFTVSKTYDVIKSDGVLFITPDYNLKDVPPFDILVVFGGDTGPGVIDSTVISWIQSKKPQIKYYLSVCTGAFILGKAGILDNLTATTYHTQIDGLAKAFPKTKVLANTRFVDNGNVITTAGISAGMDGALHLVEKLRGRPYAAGVAETIEYDKWVPENGLVLSR